jgi:predicted AAA+ superfamily ATPase
MHGYIRRNLETEIRENLTYFPVVAILGARQAGKSTTAKFIGKHIEKFVYLDLESPLDVNKLKDPELFFHNNKDYTICLDEIQRIPDLFPVLRSIVDREYFTGKIIILGSASSHLIRQSSESLAGRISYLELTPFLYQELHHMEGYELSEHWLRGSFPRSYLAPSLRLSKEWRTNFIRTFIERDIPQLGKQIPSSNLNRLLTLCAHNSGQIINLSRMGESLGISYHTVKAYIDLFEQTFIIRLLKPYYENIKKRFIKSPKIYFRDTGLLHQFLGIDDFNSLLGHPIFGSSWECFVLENIAGGRTDFNYFYYRTSNGAEIDLILVKGQKKIALEIKASSSPNIGKGFYNSIEELNIPAAFLVAPINETYEIKKGVFVMGLKHFLEYLKKW